MTKTKKAIAAAMTVLALVGGSVAAGAITASAQADTGWGKT